ncbi:hypothetical protein [Pseudoalteromonas ruthenica]|uniref:hypothetical protein n=1 Tax=Pseudoalteromonas ruthenica TaxID=151081 RepID=UPI00110B473C|nr:hypothetical protein [Pseudoalteromonas ruthenica]TMO87683.1 hypothetical protein CWC12_10415 [Pseudoalteromonas ruthenica]TMP20854.1 hypothetical protein CWC06_19535 [Pseudoalteromonas ruthenica]
MKSSKLIEKLKSLPQEKQVQIVDVASEDNSILYVGKVYHEPPLTFLQGASSSGKYSTIQQLLNRLQEIDATVPFDADIASGDDWNYQSIEEITQTEEAVLLKLSEPAFG